MHARYGIHIRKRQRITKNDRDGVPRRCKHGRPPVFSEKAQEKLKSACTASSVQLSEQEYENLQNECLRESFLEQNKLPPDVVQVCPNTIRSWDKKLGLRKVVLNKTTEARLKACNDVRNAVSFCAMNHLKETIVPLELNFNVDFTQYNPTLSDGTKTKVKICGDSKGRTLKGAPTPGQLLTAYFIEWFALISSGGIADDPLFVVGDDHMKEDDIDVHNVPGLSLSTHVGAGGTVVFRNSRSCNQTFFYWWFLKRLIPFVRRVKEQFHYDPTTPS